MSNMSKKIMGENLKLFDVWMQQESNLIQEVARSFGEVMCLHYFLNTVIKSCDNTLKYEVPQFQFSLLI
jgi:hypothetical protein